MFTYVTQHWKKGAYGANYSIEIWERKDGKLILGKITVLHIRYNEQYLSFDTKGGHSKAVNLLHYYN